MAHIPSTLVALKVVTLALGAAITYFAVGAYRRTGSRPLRALAAGFGVVTVGAAVAGLLDLARQLEWAAITAETVLIVDGLFTVVGFAVILYSLYAD